MRLFRALSSAAVAASLVAAPVVAQAAERVAPRTASEVEGEGVRGGFIIPAVAVIAIILGILALTGGSNDRPHSP